MKKIKSLRELQIIQINILKKFINFCEKNNLKYFLAYGSLLGCVREQKFIAWDDDIDVAMPRYDYEKLIELMETHKIDKYIEIYDPVKIDDSWSLVIRIFDNRTLITSSDVKIGIYIDVTPVDIFPDNFLIYNLWILWIWLNKKAMILAQVKYKSASFSKLLLKILSLPFILMAKILGYKFFKNNVINSAALFSKINYKSDKVGIILALWPTGKLKLNKNWIDEYEKKIFENIYVNVPKGYDKMLRIWYKNYWELPHEKDRVPEHSIDACWIEREKCELYETV